MGKIVLETWIRAPIEKVFELSLSVDLHMKSVAHTQERAIAGVTSGLMKLGDEVTWEARHFGITQRLTTKITQYHRSHHFRDSQQKGIFKRFDHDHFFEVRNDVTYMKDIFDFQCPLGIFGKIAEPIITRHLRRLLVMRNLTIKETAEGPLSSLKL